ncbi:4-hydroxyphenylacetate 3-monooxygenase, oxygenase component [Virgibacillus halodenitrificans]|uniref:4-hydroxyphenylacetate 3-monooxygenase, oxygenase component n=1 Tax=Virgibacillus halodenitrificans TaxID=1482 RepID=UPI00136EF2D4|nr:4-hydroxyphenylacetate 3-monooxygenase, oxygenase component [Virgibacillus halodenitrificans]MYL46487.1 4-hydroxyphenylacetate 3-monooxygenase, oxygenase component [Virgibacillus halodenitrificans]
MPAINGNEYKKRIEKLQAEIWIDGTQVKGNISEHPAWKGIIKSQGALYDLQFEPKLKGIMTYSSPLSDEQVGMSYLQPKTREDLVKRREMIQQWALASNGMMGRSPDYMNTVLMALASSAGFLEGKENCYPENLVKFYEYARENDISMTHTFINPQVNRETFYVEDTEQPIAAKVVKETDAGIIVNGARLLATQGGITDEILVLAAGGIQDKANGFAFSIPSNTKGLRFIARESFVGGESAFNYPLSSRYEEMDMVVVFDHVLVPWERVFYYNNISVSNTFMASSSFLPFTLHQAVSRQIIKTEFILGLVQSIINSICIGEYQHVQEKTTEIIIALETLKALILKAEAEAKLDEWGFMRPDQATLAVACNIFPKAYARFTDIIQQLGASGLISIPPEAAFDSDIRKDLDHYLQSKADDALSRVKLFRLAWEISMSAFGTREIQYERFFFGDPVKLASGLYQSYDRSLFVERISSFLEKE